MTVRRRESGRWAGVVCAALLLCSSNGSIGAQSGPSAAPPAAPGRLFTLAADREDVIALLRRIATEAAVSVAFATDVKGSATISLHDASFQQALSLITESAGLSFREIGGTYLITTGNADSPRVASEAFYRAQHVRADRIAETLRAIFPTDQLRVLLGPDEYNSPTLGSATSSSSSSGSSSGTTSSSSGSGGGLSLDLSGLAPPPTSPPSTGASTTSHGGPGVRQLVLIGEAPVVAHAMELCKTLDVRRRQARIDVKITDIDLEALRAFGVKWSWNSQVTAREQASSGTPDATLVPVFSLGTFLRDPLFLTAAVSALEDQGRSKLLATPSVSLLDGERASIFIGSRYLYPELTGYSSSQTPIYGKEEVSIGIRLDVSVAMTDSNDMVLTLYPQVSAIKGMLEVAGTFYPQVDTREQQTTIRARSGETIIIGGLIKEGEVNGFQGVPGLAKIPLLGELFKFRKKTTTRTELVIMITPQILADEK